MNGNRDLDELPENPQAPTAPGPTPEADRPTASEPVPAKVRPAGPDAMRDDHKHWDGTDEAVDESFPASDPPGQGVG